jgi:transposase
MANVLSEEKREQVVALGRLGWSLRRIEQSTGVRRETASAYLRLAGVTVRARGRPPNPANSGITDSASENSKPASEGITDLSRRERNAVKDSSRSLCAPFREFICERMRLGRNSMAIYQDLVDAHGFPGRYITVRRFVRALEGEKGPQAFVVIETAPGEEGQVDYGDGPMVRHPETGKYCRTRLFVLTLGYSRKSIRLLTFKSSAEIWARLHEAAFRRLGGAPKTVVLDNLKEGVLKPDIYEPALNPLYRDVLKHYGVVALPCRIRHPNRKGKIESSIGHTQKTPLKGMRFDLLEEAQAYLDNWDVKWADTRIHGTTKRQVAAMFAEEKPHLLPLPLEPFRYYRFGQRGVHLDGHIEVEGAYYSVPPGHISKRLFVQWDELYVRILEPSTGQLLREHVRQRKGSFRTRREDRPAKVPPTTLELLSRANRAGKNIGELCAEIHRRDGETGVRRMLGIFRLTRDFGQARVEDACQAALEVGVPTYRFVRRYLERSALAPISLKQVDPLIRQLTHYRDVISRLTEGEKA